MATRCEHSTIEAVVYDAGDNVDNADDRVGSTATTDATATAVATAASLPPLVRMSGLPFMWQGWNTVFNRVSDNPPSYRCEAYTMYGLIPILAATIVQDANGQWAMFRDCDNLRWPVCRKVIGNTATPCGEWTHGDRVTNNPGASWWSYVYVGYD